MFTTKHIKKIILEQSFHPTWIGIFTNPFYFARQGIAKAVKAHAHAMRGKLLDIGCGHKNYVRYYTNTTEYIGVEYDTAQNRETKQADFFYDGNKLPFPDNFFDCIVSNEVFEHVFNPQQHLQEIHRVLKAQGQLFMTVPFAWDEHEQPHDFARYSSFGLISLLKDAGFEILHAEKSCADVSALFQLINAYIYKTTCPLRRNGYLDLLTTGIFNAPFNLLGVMLRHILPKNSDLYLDNIIVVKKKC